MSIGIVVQVPKTSAGCEREELERGVRAAYCCGKGQGKAAWPSQKKKKKEKNPPSPVFTHPNGLPSRPSAVSGSLWTGKGLCCQAAW